MKKRKIWAAIDSLTEPAALVFYITCVASWGAGGGFLGNWIGHQLGLQKDTRHLLILFFFFASYLVPFFAYAAVLWWQNLEPIEPSEMFSQKADPQHKASGAISEASTTGGELSGVDHD